jgi:hypothetical protein
LRTLKLQLIIFVVLLVTCVLIGDEMAVATVEMDSVKSEASRRLNDLKHIEDRLESDIDVYNQHIDDYQRAVEARRVALQQVRNEIRNLELAFKWF